MWGVSGSSLTKFSAPLGQIRSTSANGKLTTLGGCANGSVLVSTTTGFRRNGGAFSICMMLASTSICSKSGLLANCGNGLFRTCRYAGHPDPSSTGKFGWESVDHDEALN